MSKSLTSRNLTIQDLVRSDVMAEKAEKSLGSKSRQFLTSVLSLANSDSKIAECEPYSTYNACLTAATLDLPINQNLGHAYIVPYFNRKKNQMEAQFQMGWKGFVQLAMRSGKFKNIGARQVRESELVGVDEFTGEPIFKFNLEDDSKAIGYMAYFRLLNGFEKSFYMSNEELTAHAKKYSQTFKKGFGVWVDDFDAMAQKTVLKLLLSKFAPLSIEMQNALVEDQKVGDEYLDNQPGSGLEVEDAEVVIPDEDTEDTKND